MRRIREFYSPRTVEEAVSLLRRFEGKAIPLAGGTDIAVDRDADAEVLVDITRLGLDRIQEEDSKVLIGAAVTVHDLSVSSVLKGMADGILCKAAESFISRQVRNAATIGGNLARAAPSADLAPALLALEAEVCIAGVGRRWVPLRDFFLGPGQTILRQEILTEVAIPKSSRGASGEFLKVGRTAEDIALVSAAVSLEGDGGRMKKVRIAVGASGPTPLRIPKAESLLERSRPDPGVLEEVGRIVEAEVRPVDDIRASAEYRRVVSGVLVRRALRRCWARKGWMDEA